MDSMSPLCRQFAVIGVVMAVSGMARAQAPEASSAAPPPAETQSGLTVELALEATYTTVPIRGGTTPFGAGFGGRLGFLFSHIYLGATAIGYLGGSDIDISDRAILYGAELGYDIVFDAGAGQLTLRPQVGVGGASIFHTDPSLAQSSGTDVVSSASGRGSSSRGDTTVLSNAYVQPGVTLMYTQGMPFVAANANVLVLPGINYSGVTTTWLSYGLQGQVGLRF